jgi:S1-C subfamily serine protease
MFVSAIESVEKALFPIFRITIENPGGNGPVHFGIAGSAFFIDDRGTFATVAHTFDKRPPNTKYLFCGCLPKQYQSQIEVEEIVRDDKADILLGRVPLATPHFLALSPSVSPIGRSVCISGYPLAKIVWNPATGFDVSGARTYYRQTMVIDYARCVDSETDRTHEGVLLQDAALFGQSGGAVFDMHGLVVGMQASVMHPRDSVAGNKSRKITVENGVAISSDKILQLYERTLGLRTVVPKTEVATDVDTEQRRTA